VRLLAPFVVAVVLASPAQFLQKHQLQDGGFAETGGAASPALTAWAALGLHAAGEETGAALDYLRARESEPMPASTRALVALAAAALGDPGLAAALPTRPTQTSTVIWTILALRQAGRPAPQTLVRTLLARQARSGGWGWARGVVPDSNDTAAAVQALRAVRVRGGPIRRALAYLRTLRHRDGGFALGSGRKSDAQSTAWVIQAFLAAGSKPPAGAYSYLRGLRREDGSYRYSKAYAVTPVWVTAQVLPAVMRAPYPLRQRD